MTIQNTKKIKNGNKGFTLIELSIVLIIISLIIGGIIGGQSLVRSSEINAMMTEANVYKRSVNLFIDKYDALPGDMRNAYDYWGAKCASSAGVCNGNGDGLIGYQGEDMMAWRHLSLSGLISGSYSGQTSFNFMPFNENTFAFNNKVKSIFNKMDNLSLIPSAYAQSPYNQDADNTPDSKVKGGGFWMVEVKQDGSPNQPMPESDASAGNALIMASLSSGLLRGGIVTPTEMLNIDRKLDNGDAATGNVMGRDAYQRNGYCIDPDTGNLDFSNKERDCVAVFWLTK